ncbi:coiled-coil domain-containing protein 81-like isoform X1 [Anas acuta]|uniref:coiled-coil domain-containing protein 81-like isoform X1 n=2 Tax=Anas acuta TaxID=28680 RepID=UPI0035C8D686
MQKRVTFADEVLPNVRRTPVRFWDGMKVPCLTPSITSKEKISVWDAVSAYIHEHLLLHQGVRIPALGSFDVVPKLVKDGNKTLILQMPTFRLARNLVVTHSLTANKEYLPGHKELEPLHYPEVAAQICLSSQRVESCIQGTTSLISRCVGKGENIALVLRDVGVLLIEGTRVEMKFYSEFLQKLSGKENLQKAFFKVPQLMDVVVSRRAPLASLTFSGRVIVFPEFEMESMPKKPPQEHSKEKKEGAFPLLGQAGGRKAAAGSLRRDGELTPGKGLGLPSLAPTGSTEEAALKGEAQKAGKAPLRLPAIPGTPRKAEKSSPKGKTGQAKTPGASMQRAGRGAGMFPPCMGENPAAKKPPRPPGPTELSFPVISVSSPASSEASLPEEPPYNVYRLQPPGKEGAERLKNRPETFWTVMKDPQKKALSVNGTNSTRPVAPAPRKLMSAQPKPPKTGPGLSVLWPRPP